MGRSVQHQRVRSGSDLSLVASPAFLGALALLIANDHWLKATQPGLVTGKLSDFAGLFVVGVALAALRPAGAHAGAVIVAALFVIWKSPAATPLIDLWNATIPWPVARTVDATDLIALVSLPVALRYARATPRSIPWRPARWAATIATMLAVMATSRPREQEDIGSVYVTAMPKREVSPVIDELGRVWAPPGSEEDTLHVRLPEWSDFELTLALREQGRDSTEITVVRMMSDVPDPDPTVGRTAFEREVLPHLRRHEAWRLLPALPALPLAKPTELPAGVVLRDTSTYRSDRWVETRARLLRSGRFIDWVDLTFGVHAVGRDSLVFLPVAADPADPADPARADIGHLALLHGYRRIDLEELLPHLSSAFSSPVVHNGTLIYWGMRRVEPGRPVALYAIRYDFASARLDSLLLGERTIPTDNRLHLLPPTVYETGIVFAVDSIAWVVRPDFSRMLGVPR